MRAVRVLPIRRLLSMGMAAVFGVALVTATPLAPARATPGGNATDMQIIAATTYWNGVVLEAFRRKGGGPGPIARIAAMVHTAMFDTANSVWYSQSGELWYESYAYTGLVSPSVNADLALGYAARDMLTHLEPGQQAYFAQKFTERYGTSSQSAAYSLASSAVNAMIAARANDGSASGQSYTPDGVAGAWRPTPVNGSPCTTVDPHWGNVRPFTMTSPTQFRRQLPYSGYTELIGSTAYRSQLEEVRRLGRFDAEQRGDRTAAQTQTAWFWANDLDGTYKPPGQYLATAMSAASTYLASDPVLGDGLAISRLMALVSLAMADAGIAAWQMKYLNPIDLWRPQTAIQQDPVSPDPTWLPLSADRNNNRFSPCFPAYVSGHATFGAAWAGVMRGILGDQRTVTVATEDPHAVGVTRTFTSFTAAATENARSRVYLGVHFQWDSDDGLAAGYDIANRTYTTYLSSLV